MRIFALLQEPANYTQSLVRNIYAPRGVDYAFIHGASAAAAESMVSIGTGWRRFKFLCRALKAHDAFVVNGYTGSACLWMIWLNVLFFRKPLALDSDTELRIPANPIKRALKWLWLHFLFTRKYVFGFAGGNFGHKELFRHYGMAESRICLMPMMVDNSLYARKDIARPSDVFCFGYIGRLIALKQVDKIIEAIRCLGDEGRKVELVIVGDGECRAQLEQTARGLPVVFSGALFGEEKIRALHTLDCLVLYSDYESWGLVVNEALASGIPVVVSDKVGARRDLVEGEAPSGLVVKWDEVADLTNKMRQIAADKDLYSRLSQNGIKRMANWDYSLYGKQFDGWTATLARCGGETK